MSRFTCHRRSVTVFLTIPLIFSSSALQAADIDDVQEQLLADIQQAQNALSATQERVSRERGELSSRLNQVQNRVLDLRQQAVAARRLADEDTLSLSRIEERLEGWQEQSRFQQRLLSGYLNRIGRRQLDARQEQTIEQDIALFSALLREQESSLYPAPRTEQLALPDGQISQVSTLSLGPVHLYYQQDMQQTGLLNRSNGLNTVNYQFQAQHSEGVAGLFTSGRGALTFDPTLNRAVMLEADRENLLEHLEKGGLWVIPILLFALFATCIAVFKAISLFRLPALLPSLADQAEKALHEGQETVAALQARLRGFQAELFRVAMQKQTASQRDERLYALLLEQRNKLERWLGAVAVTASVSPLLGLLGTVSGMITTFKLMTLFGSGDASSVSAGISEALVTTELGLVVAIPALLAHALMSRRVKGYFAALENDAVHLSQLPEQQGGQ